MGADFDPYHRWLGIAPKDQPPTHYRLLGLIDFEADPEVIRDAVERQSGHVRRYQLGPHSEVSQRILNELAAAKACLFDAEKKAEYDRHLRTTVLFPNVTQNDPQTAIPPSPTPVPAIPIPPPIVERETAENWLGEMSPARTSWVRRGPLNVPGRRWLSTIRWPKGWYVTGLAGGLVAVVGAIFIALATQREGGLPQSRTMPRLALIWPANERDQAILFIDGQSQRLPEPLPESDRVEFALPSGRHEICVRRPGFDEFRETVDLREGSTIEVVTTFTRRVLPAVYRVEIDPPAAKVKVASFGTEASVEGEGPSRKVTVASPGEKARVVLVVTMPGYESLEKEITPKPGESANLALRLKAIGAPAVSEMTISLSGNASKLPEPTGRPEVESKDKGGPSPDANDSPMRSDSKADGNSVGGAKGRTDDSTPSDEEATEPISPRQPKANERTVSASRAARAAASFQARQRMIYRANQRGSAQKAQFDTQRNNWNWGK